MGSELGNWAYKQWQEKYGQEPIWDKKQWAHLAHLERLLQDKFKATWTAYLEEAHEFYRGHPPALLSSNIGKFQVVAMEETPAQHIEKAKEISAELITAVQRNRKLQEAESEARRNRYLRKIRKAILDNEGVNKNAYREGLAAAKKAMKK